MKARMDHRKSPNPVRSKTMFPMFQFVHDFPQRSAGARSFLPLLTPESQRFVVHALLQIYLSSTYLSLHFCGSNPGDVTLHLSLNSEV